MDSFEWNKIWGALLASVLMVMVLREIGSFAFHEEPLETPGYAIDLPEKEDAGTAVAAVEEVLDLGALLLEASAEGGERVAKQCAACHNFVQGGANQLGPNLWGVLGRDIASKDGFSYSAALSGKEGEWTYEKMYAFLENPSEWAPGTAMNYVGLRRQRDRVNILAYMAQQADAPLPFPAPLEAEAAGDEGTDDAPTEAVQETGL